MVPAECTHSLPSEYYKYPEGREEKNGTIPFQYGDDVDDFCRNLVIFKSCAFLLFVAMIDEIREYIHPMKLLKSFRPMVHPTTLAINLLTFEIKNAEIFEENSVEVSAPNSPDHKLDY